MMKFLSALVGCLLWSHAAFAQAYPNIWYWSVIDTNIATQVYGTGSVNAFVSNTDATYTAWLVSLQANPLNNTGYVAAVAGAANNGSGLCRITVADGSIQGWATNQVKTVTGVGGATGCNVAAAITVINSTTVDLQGTTFGGAYTSGGVIGSGTPIATVAGLYALINAAALQNWKNSSAQVNILHAQTSDVVLTNPVAPIQVIDFNGAGHTVTLPPMNTINSLPIGYSIKFLGNGGNSYNILQNATAGCLTCGYIGNVDPNAQFELFSRTNVSPQGNFQVNKYWQAAAAAFGIGVLANINADTVVGNWTGGNAAPTANAMPPCADSGGNHLNYVSGTGAICGTSAAAPSTNVPISNIEFVIDGGGSAITTGTKGYLTVDYACTINQSTLLADRSGSIVVDVWKTTYANFDAGATHPVAGDKITASAPPTISSATKAQDATLTGWTTSVSAGDILAFNVNSAATIQRATLALKCTKN